MSSFKFERGRKLRTVLRPLLSRQLGDFRGPPAASDEADANEKKRGLRTIVAALFHTVLYLTAPEVTRQQPILQLVRVWSGRYHR